MIEIKQLKFGYGSNTVLNDISAEINDGCLTAIIGLNGAGKSTLFKCLSKQASVYDGDILINEKSINLYSFKEYAKIVSFVPQLSSANLVDCKVRDFLVEGRTPYLSAFAVPGIKEYEFSEKIALKMGIEQYLSFDFNKLSGGQQQLVLLTRALVQDTQIILMDEPMSALDLKNQSFLLKVIKRLSDEGKTVIFSTHNPNHALLLGCNTMLLQCGRIIGHDTAEKCLTEKNLRSVFDCDVKFLCGDKQKTIQLII